MNFKIGELHPNTPHLFADLAELLLLTGYYGRKYLHKSDLAELLAKEVVSYEEIDEEDDVAEVGQASVVLSRWHEEQIENIMTQLEYRSRSLSLFYPFITNGEELRICANFNEKHRAYRLLLACSRLRSFESKGIVQKWSKYFAKISKIALVGLLPSYAQVRIFDANSDDRKNYYGTNFRDAIRKLGEDLRVTNIHEDNVGKASSSGDGGIDLVGVIDFDDGAISSYAILGQCGAREIEWPKKTLEAHASNLASYFHMQYNYTSAMFTPILFRHTNGEWVDNRCANSVFIADRARILKLLELQNKCELLVAEPWFLDFESDLTTIAGFAK